MPIVQLFVGVLAASVAVFVLRRQRDAIRIAAATEASIHAYAYLTVPEGAAGIDMGVEPKFKELRTPKRMAMRERERLERELGREEGAKEWARIVSPPGVRAPEAALPTPYNRVAFYLADALQILGLTCYAGGVSLAYVLANLGDSIVDDWYVCEAWIAAYRMTQAAEGFAPRHGVAYHRRHAEWLALAAILYMSREWNYPRAVQLVNRLGGEIRVRETLQLLSETDQRLIASATIDDLNGMCGTHLHVPINTLFK